MSKIEKTNRGQITAGMKATAELQVIPIGDSVSVRQEIARVVELLREYDFIVETHASGTNIEGRVRRTRVRTVCCGWKNT